MDREKVLKALDELSKAYTKKNFRQSVDFIVNVKDIDLKKNENQLEFFAPLTHDRGRRIKICGLVGGELFEEAKKTLDKAINSDDFEQYLKDKKAAKVLAAEFDFFVAQANIMNKVAASFGKIFGPRGKMPNPKAGCVVPPKATLAPLAERLQKLVQVSFKKGPVFQCSIGVEGTSNDVLADNILSLYDQIIHHLPGEKNNIRNVLVKYTMSKAVVVE